MKTKTFIKITVATVSFVFLLSGVARAGDAGELWNKQCAKCHGKEGKGDTKMGQKLGIKDYSDAKVQADVKDEDVTKAIKEGVKDKEGKTVMKPAEGLSDDEIKALATHFRSLKK